MLNPRKLVRTLAAIGLCCAIGVAAAQAPAGETDKKSKRCIRLAEIQSIDIIDNKHIAFQTSINEYYLNSLPYACSGLKLHDAIMYRTSLPELCDVDVITVLEQLGAGYWAGPSCGLGRFDPITKEEIRKLKDDLKQQAELKRQQNQQKK